MAGEGEPLLARVATRGVAQRRALYLVAIQGADSAAEEYRGASNRRRCAIAAVITIFSPASDLPPPINSGLRLTSPMRPAAWKGPRERSCCRPILIAAIGL